MALKPAVAPIHACQNNPPEKAFASHKLWLANAFFVYLHNESRPFSLPKERRCKRGVFEELRKRRRKKQGKPEARLEHLEKQLHPLEFGLLAVSMSVDGIVSGVFAADLPVTGGQIFFASFAVGMAAMYAGTAIGKKTGQKNGGNGALFGGILFYLLAFLKLT